MKIKKKICITIAAILVIRKIICYQMIFLLSIFISKLIFVLVNQQKLMCVASSDWLKPTQKVNFLLIDFNFFGFTPEWDPTEVP